MIDRRHVAAPQSREADAAPVERDARRTIDRKPQAATVKLADRELWGPHSYDDATVDGLRRRCAGWHKDNGGAEKRQPKPSHVRMLIEAGQRGVSCV